MSSEITRKSIIITLIIIIMAIIFAFSIKLRADDKAPDPVPQTESLTDKQIIELQIVLVQEKMARLKAEYELAKRDLEALKVKYREELRKESEAIKTEPDDMDKKKSKRRK